MKKNNTKKIIIAILVLAVLVIAGLLVAYNSKPATNKGDKHVVIEVVDDKATSKKYEVDTDAKYLRGAMDDVDELKYEGNESSTGLMVTSVNGLSADYTKDGAYWAFYVNGEYANYGVDKQPVKDGDNFKIEYTKADETQN